MTQNQYPSASSGFVSEFLASDRGFATWNYDPTTTGGGGIPTLGTVTNSLFKWPGGLLSKLFIATISPEIGGTAGQNLMGVVNQAGVLLGTSVDITTPLASSGLIEADLFIPLTLPAGEYYAAMLFNASSVGPNVKRLSSDVTTNVIGIAPNNQFRGALGPAGQTSLPSNQTLTSGGGLIYWVAAA